MLCIGFDALELEELAFGLFVTSFSGIRSGDSPLRRPLIPILLDDWCRFKVVFRK